MNSSAESIARPTVRLPTHHVRVCLNFTTLNATIKWTADCHAPAFRGAAVAITITVCVVDTLRTNAARANDPRLTVSPNKAVNPTAYYFGFRACFWLVNRFACHRFSLRSRGGLPCRSSDFQRTPAHQQRMPWDQPPSCRFPNPSTA